ncbi:MAG: LysM peptidoglycan-binding domain-containing protein [Opitutales bacterium]
MRLFSPCQFALAFIALTLLPGCGYVHFGRYPAATKTSTELASQNSDLRLENKILKQEISLANKERDALREALDNSRSGNGNASQLAAQLNETTKELGTLRVNYAQLESELNRQRSTAAGSAENLTAMEQVARLKDQLGVTEEKLAQVTLNNNQLQQENTRLRQEADRLHQENTNYVQQVQSLTQQNEQVTQALSQLNTELLAQKNARQQAEDAARASQAQLQLVLSHAAEPAPTSLSQTRQSAASSARDLDATLKVANAPGSLGTPTAELRTSAEHLQQVADAMAKDATRYHFVIQDDRMKPGRYVTVAEGDTLQTLALKYYGNPDRWRMIMSANADQIHEGSPLKAGMKIVIPE